MNKKIKIQKKGDKKIIPFDVAPQKFFNKSNSIELDKNKI